MSSFLMNTYLSMSHKMKYDLALGGGIFVAHHDVMINDLMVFRKVVMKKKKLKSILFENF